MFRKMRRQKQAMTKAECIELLKTETRGVLSVQGEDGYPYGIPMNHYYHETEGRLYFHGAKIGHRVDAIRQNPKVSYCVYGEEEKWENDWAYYVKSVVIFGKALTVEDREKTIAISRALCTRFPVPDGYADQEIEKDAPGTLCFFIEIEHMTGKLVHEA